MYFKLALQNVKKSFKDYLIYFLTLAFSVCLFYSFNSFQAQQAVMEMSQSQAEIIDLVQLLMEFLSVFVAVVLGFLIIYANNFLIKRRKKELGLYMLLGMPKKKISQVLVYETFFIGLLSLGTGLLIGIFASQLLTVVTANLFEVTLNYAFVFSMNATMITVIAFALIFLVIMVFNTIILNRYKLIDLLTANKKNETLKIKNFYVSIFLFLLSIMILAFTYWFALSEGMNALNQLEIIIPCGSIGTVLFFMSLSGFLLKFVQSSKSLYFRKLNMFVLKQVNASINSNFISMSIVCIMLLMSIGALATGTNLNRTLNHSILLTTPYDYTASAMFYNHDMVETMDLSEIKKDLMIDETLIENETFVHIYSSDINVSVFEPYIKESLSKKGFDIEEVYHASFEILPLSEFNVLRKQYGLSEISLTNKEAYLFTSVDMLDDVIQEIMKADVDFILYGKSMQIVNDTYDLMNTGTTINSATITFGLVVPDQMIPENAELNNVYWNVMLQDDVEQREFDHMVSNELTEYIEKHMAGIDQSYTIFSCCSDDVKENSKGLSVVMTYIGLYLGLIFLIASAVILALQQLSQASDNRQRYQILHKIGAEQKMISHSILLQLSIYFFMPMVLAIVHSIVGIQVVNAIVVAFGKSDIFTASLITGSMIIVIYGAYFFITYLGYKNILSQQ